VTSPHRVLRCIDEHVISGKVHERQRGAVDADECFVGGHAIINPSVKIYPFKMVEPNALVTSSIVWESKGARTLFGRRGVIGGLLQRAGIEGVFTWRAVVVAMMVMSLPLLVRGCRVAFEEVNVRFEEIARTLGASDARVFTTITLPLARRGIVGGIVLGFARAIGEFGATILIAGDIPGRTTTVALAIYDRVELGRDADAYRLLVVAVAIAFITVWTSEALLRNRELRR